MIIIPPRTQKICRLPVNIEKGTGLLDHITFAKFLESPKAVVTIDNFYATTLITNSSELEAEIKINAPYNIEPINAIEFNFIEKMETDQELNEYHDNLLKSNLKNIRLEHCNLEEKNM